jgi:hypothetical protein
MSKALLLYHFWVTEYYNLTTESVIVTCVFCAYVPCPTVSKETVIVSAVYDEKVLEKDKKIQEKNCLNPLKPPSRVLLRWSLFLVSSLSLSLSLSYPPPPPPFSLSSLETNEITDGLDRCPYMRMCAPRMLFTVSTFMSVYDVYEYM